VVSPSSGPLTTIFSQDAIYVLFPIAVRTAIELEKRYADKGGINAVVLRLRLPDGTLYGQQGQIDYVEPTIAANTDTIIVRGKIANPKHHETGPGEPTDRWLTDGEFVTAIVEGVQPVQVLGIPRAAVLSDQQGNYVFVVNAQNRAEQRRIQLGQSTPETAVVTAGLKEGETVIVDGLQRVRPGIEVQPGPATPPASSAARAQAAAAEATTATNPSPVSGSPPAGTSTTGSTSGSGAGR
ncbi:MAG: efflux transporter periplasmic adaptor subunit, partial [Acetobacteraceae bacterium]|nr:efflux transporter periplasmic adaptor subunit [Acetobacteraceae bacterium]